MSNVSQRTQIYLPKELRREIDKYLSGESLSEYLRKAAQERLKKQKQKKEDLKKLAKEIIYTPKENSWKDVDIIKWQREIREDRGAT